MNFEHDEGVAKNADIFFCSGSKAIKRHPLATKNREV